ncbi:MAG: hypothetical protein HY791_04565 [Deltaproteobacteria bacterium]|nr:hypothetical protein [Deltaproteobacteria bacterium]
MTARSDQQARRDLSLLGAVRAEVMRQPAGHAALGAPPPPRRREGPRTARPAQPRERARNKGKDVFERNPDPPRRPPAPQRLRALPKHKAPSPRLAKTRPETRPDTRPERGATSLFESWLHATFVEVQIPSPAKALAHSAVRIDISRPVMAASTVAIALSLLVLLN